MKQEWEYISIETTNVTPVALTEQMNQLGQEGWEFAVQTDDGRYYFKRLLKEKKREILKG